MRNHTPLLALVISIGLVPLSAPAQLELQVEPKVDLDIIYRIDPDNADPTTNQYEFRIPDGIEIENGLTITIPNFEDIDPELDGGNHVSIAIGDVLNSVDENFEFLIRGYVTAPPSSLNGSGDLTVQARISAPIRYINPTQPGSNTAIDYNPLIEGKFLRSDQPDPGLMSASFTMSVRTEENGNPAVRPLTSLTVSQSEVGGLNTFGQSSGATVITDTDSDGEIDAFELNQGVFPDIRITEGEVFLVDIDVLLNLQYDLFEAPNDPLLVPWGIDLNDTVSLELIAPAGGRFELVPEPSSALLLGGMTLFVMRRRR